MPTCPAGHQSNTMDYCDECGAPMNATTQFSVPVPQAPPNPGASGLPMPPGMAPPSSPQAQQQPWFNPDTQPCPECGEPLLDRFCEACGWGPGVAPAIPSTKFPPPGSAPQFPAGPVPPGQAQVPVNNAYDPFTGGPPPEQAPYPPPPPPGEPNNPFGPGPGAGQPPAPGRYDPYTGAPMAPPDQQQFPPPQPQPGEHNPFAGAMPPPMAPPSAEAADPFAAAFPPPPQQQTDPFAAGAQQQQQAPPGYGQPPAAGPGPWQLIADADRAYFERICRLNDLDPNTMQFPAYVPQRRFRLHGPQQLVGRHSASKGISPDIDLSGPPTDAAVSHAHALFIAQPDGSWSVVDVGSSNGTYLNESTQPLARNIPQQLNLGDRVHVGLWTTLTVTNGM